MSAKDDITFRLAKAIRAAWVDRLDWDELAHAALEFLTSTGRLIPAGGMALTAEQVEDVRTVAWYTGAGLSRAPMAETHRLRALFPATEPAAVRDGSDLVVVQRSHTAKAVQSWMTLDLWTDLGKNDKDFDAEYERQGFGDLWATLLGEVRALVQATTPTPAEPAAVEVDPRAESQAACLYAKLLTAGEDPGLIFQAVLWAYERVKSTPEIIWLEDLYQAWESRASAEATVNSTLKVPAPAEPAEEETKAETVRTHTPAHHNPETGTTRITVQRSCNRCGRNLGDATEKELDACVSGAPLPDVHEECGCDASPVVPALTETGPWQRIEDVPKSVYLIKDCEGDKWRRDRKSWEVYSERGFRWHPGFPDRFALFVAAEEG